MNATIGQWTSAWIIHQRIFTIGCPIIHMLTLTSELAEPPAFRQIQASCTADIKLIRNECRYMYTYRTVDLCHCSPVFLISKWFTSALVALARLRSGCRLKKLPSLPCFQNDSNGKYKHHSDPTCLYLAPVLADNALHNWKLKRWCC